ncbi:MAG: coenzyme F420-reducing hydrogenase, FrhD protein [Methanomicrobiales archaeon]|nr:coenzyme F420-reducing hydrogenase, FrhD protein [Methanomicrobiales archaeon]
MSDWYSEIMVVGCGNPLQTDDGFGPAVVSELKKLALPGNVKVLDAGLAGPHYLFTLMAQSDAPVKKLVIVDILDFGGEPGQIAKITPDLLPPGSYTDDHSWGLKEPLRVLADRVEIVILGCQPECIELSRISNEDEEYEFWVTDTVKKAIPKAVRIVLDEIGVDYGHTISSQETHHGRAAGEADGT